MYKKLAVQKDAKIIDAFQIIDKYGKHIAFVLDGAKLLGSLSDGDIRRHLINGGKITDNVLTCANKNPVTISSSAGVIEDSFFNKYPSIDVFPVVDEEGNCIKVISEPNLEINKLKKINAPVVIMAGGKGERLMPFTKILPKPIIPVGDKTITERIINEFQKYKIKDFYLVVNYKKQLIKSYFNEINLDIKFKDEEKFLGTGGGLKLLENDLKETFFLTNCDIFVEQDYSEIYDSHKKNKNIVTIVSAIGDIKSPYGEIVIDKANGVRGISEKPSFHPLINTGFYVAEPKFLEYINKDERINATEIIERCIAAGEKVGVFPISQDRYFDMGQFNSFDAMYNFFKGMEDGK